LNHFLAAREKVWKKFENHSFNLYWFLIFL
jgi:hypothetical protein